MTRSSSMSRRGARYMATQYRPVSTATRCKRAINLLDLLLLAALLAASCFAGYAFYYTIRASDVDLSKSAVFAESNSRLSRTSFQLMEYVVVTRHLAALLLNAVQSAPPQYDGYALRNYTRPVSDSVFNRFGREEIDRLPAIYNFQCRPGAIITQVYPPGTAPVGTDFAARFPAEEAAIRNSSGYISGPRMLLQGFPGFVVSWPIWRNASAYSRQYSTDIDYWGAVGIVINLQAFVNRLPFDNATYTYKLTLTNSVTGARFVLGDWNSSTATRDRFESGLRLQSSAKVSTVVIDLELSLPFPSAAGALGGAAAIAVSLALVIFVVYVSVVRARMFRMLTKATDDAPLGPTVALVFTDVVNSTLKWSTYPDTMAQATTVHHRVVRHHIAEHASYEVKCLGDGFMIACADAATAVDLAMQIHQGLKEADWPTNAETRERLELQVRIGIHVGPCAVHFDDIAKQPDYYGPTVNCAARCEKAAWAGTTAVTSAVIDALPVEWFEESEEDYLCTKSIGLQTMKGIPAPVQVSLVSPLSLSHRMRNENGQCLPVDEPS